MTAKSVGERAAPYSGEPVFVLAAWHLPRMRSMPVALWRVRRLDRATRGAPGVLWVHRWLSRRSLLLTTRWTDLESAETWIGGEAFRRTDAELSGIVGARSRLECHVTLVPAPDPTGVRRGLVRP